MLRKLLKYEFKATGRTFLPLYLVLVIFACINKLFMVINASNSGLFLLSIPADISRAVYVILIIGIFVLTFLTMIKRFHKNLLSSEGYLSFTLPVKSWAHILCKLITSIVWIIASAVVTFFTIVIIEWSKEFFSTLPQEFWQFIDQANQAVGMHGYLYVIEFITALLSGLAMSILTIYVAIAIGHLVNSRRRLASIGAFLGITFLSQIIPSVCLKFLSLFHIDIWFNQLPPLTMAHWILIGASVINLVLCAIYFIVTNYVLNKRLNLN